MCVYVCVCACACVCVLFTDFKRSEFQGRCFTTGVCVCVCVCVCVYVCVCVCVCVCTVCWFKKSEFQGSCLTTGVMCVCVCTVCLFQKKWISRQMLHNRCVCQWLCVCECVCVCAVYTCFKRSEFQGRCFSTGVMCVCVFLQGNDIILVYRSDRQVAPNSAESFSIPFYEVKSSYFRGFMA